jgi:hypothetical protein
MSRLDELKKQYPELNLTILDLFKSIDPTKTYKYVPLFCKILGKRFRIKDQYPSDDYVKATLEIRTLMTEMGFNSTSFSDNQVYFFRHIQDFFPSENFTTLNEFISLMEKNKIENKDVTSYSSMEQIRSSVSLAGIKELNRELEGQVIKEYEDDKWVIVRPLTFAASAKYGASTRWCTTYQKEKQYFERYWRQGILVYFINKLTGYKFAGYKNLSDNEISFWNAEDTRVDYLLLDVDDYLFPIVRKILSSKDTNKNLCSDELQEKVHQECIEMEPKMSVGEIAVEMPRTERIRPVELMEQAMDGEWPEVQEPVTEIPNEVVDTIRWTTTTT